MVPGQGMDALGDQALVRMELLQRLPHDGEQTMRLSPVTAVFRNRQEDLLLFGNGLHGPADMGVRFLEMAFFDGKLVHAAPYPDCPPTSPVCQKLMFRPCDRHSWRALTRTRSGAAI